MDAPVRHDARVAVVPHVSTDDALRTVEGFRAVLASSSFDERRLERGAA